MSNYSEADFEAAQKHSSQHYKELARSEVCACFYCKKTFKPSEIEEWIENSTTALCPKCGIDSVLGDASSLPVADEVFLSEMHKYWFL